MEDALQKTAVLAVLGLNSFSDIKRREIMLWPTLLFGGAGTVLRVLEALESGAGLQTALLLLPSVLPGILLAAAAALSGGKIGFGDAILVAAAGIWMKGETCICWVMGGFMLAVLWIVLRFMMDAGRGRPRSGGSIPFVPFLLLAAVPIL